MNLPQGIPLVTTLEERCRVCYTCVRECPAKAIRIAGGQAEIIPERCIGCGNCVRVCSQRAKKGTSTLGDVTALLESGSTVCALLAPSFPAEFTDVPCRTVVGMVRAAGFARVHEVAFGADLVAIAYAKLLTAAGQKRYIATTCPGIAGYVERYHPDLVSSLAPIVSPMVAAARALRQYYGDDAQYVFIGPCFAKKGEASSPLLRQEVDGALTFVELRKLLALKGIEPAAVEPSGFDPPYAGAGALFPVSRGMLQAAGLPEDLLTGSVVAADGRTSFTEAIKEFESGDLDASLLEVLCCHGCVMGAGISSPLPLFSRRSQVSQYVRRRLREVDMAQWRRDMARFADLDLSRSYEPNDQRVPIPSPDELRAIMARMGKSDPADELNCGACGYETCYEHAIAIHKGLAESEMCLPYTIDELKRSVTELAESHEQLASAQQALAQSEKLASMGQLAAGIAHEVNNPLGVVLMYAHLMLEDNGIGSGLRDDLAMIVEQADRCKKIVAGLLHFARQNEVLLKRCNIPEVVDRCMQALCPPEGIEVKVVHLSAPSEADIDHDQFAQVLTNLVNNAYTAMSEGGTLTVTTDGDEQGLVLAVADTGCGIAEESRARIFEPFFTTKQMGVGTGLGLAVIYGIVKMHRGDIRVESNADPSRGPTGTTFRVVIPRYAQSEH